MAVVVGRSFFRRGREEEKVEEVIAAIADGRVGRKVREEGGKCGKGIARVDPRGCINFLETWRIGQP